MQNTIINPKDVANMTADQLYDALFIEQLINSNDLNLMDVVNNRVHELGIAKGFSKKFKAVERALSDRETNNNPLFLFVRQKLKELQPHKNATYKSGSDKALSQLFADVFKDYARFNVDAKEWFYYDGKRWQIDIGGMHVKAYIKTLSDALYHYAGNITDENYRVTINSLQKHARRITILEDAKDRNFVHYTDFDKQKYLLNCQNCVLDLKTFTAKPHDANLMLSKIANVNYSETATSPLFDKFLKEVLYDDTSKIDYLQKVFGYCLTGDNNFHEYYMCYGSTTRNGKSTLVNTITYMLGDYAKTCPAETFGLTKRNSQGPSSDLSYLRGARLVHLGETPKGMALDVALVKRFTGGEPISAREMYERQSEYIPNGKIVINTNFYPVMSDDTIFNSCRVKVVEFNRHFEPQEQDVLLSEKLQSDDNLSGILNWCIAGLKAYKEKGGRIIPPQAVQDATNDYRARSDKIKAYISECLIKNENGKLKLQDVYNDYVTWCKANGYIGIENKQTFTEKLKARNMIAKNTRIKTDKGSQPATNVVIGFWFNKEDGHGPYEYV